MTLRHLPTNLINQISAGEVIERPASALKELIENALDAGAQNLDIHIRGAGKVYMSVQDDGCGLSPQDMVIALDRHTTSKLDEGNLWDIQTFGFRGEALPSIGAVSRLTMTSCLSSSQEAWKVRLEAGEKFDIEPALLAQGTRVEVADLFYATPARLKFLKADSTENSLILEVIQRLALAHPFVSFCVKNDQKEVLKLETIHHKEPREAVFERTRQVLGKDFAQNSLTVDCQEGGFSVYGLIGLPTLHRRTTAHQFLYVNQRPVKDKVLQSALRDAYHDVIPHGRYPMVALFIQVPRELVDVNVHPAKTEVRFRESSAVRAFILRSLKKVLAQARHLTSQTISNDALVSFAFPEDRRFSSAGGGSAPMEKVDTDVPKTLQASSPVRMTSWPVRQASFPKSFFYAKESAERALEPLNCEQSIESQDLASEDDVCLLPLGEACAQIHETYIVAQSSEGIILVDQHAAHERLVYEGLKKSFFSAPVPSQTLLVPEIVPMKTQERDALLNRSEEFHKLGLDIESFGDGILVRSVPALLIDSNIQRLVLDLLDEIKDLDVHRSLQEKQEEICSTMACHGSIRAGKKMSMREMNALLRQMEQTAYSGQCNHGRPTYILLKKTDIEKLFGRR